MYGECIETTYTMSSVGTSNNAISTYEQQWLSGKSVKSPVQAQQWVQITAIIAKLVKRDNEARDSNNYLNYAIKLWRVLLGSSSDWDLIFTRAGRQPIFLVKHLMELISWTMSAGIYKTSKQGHVDYTFPQYRHSKTIRITGMMECARMDRQPLFDNQKWSPKWTESSIGLQELYYSDK